MMLTLLNELAARSVANLHALRQTQINNYAAYSRIALYAYDILLTLDREKELIWKEGLRPSSLLYYATRYPVVARQIFNLVSARTHIHHCTSWSQFIFAISILIPRITIVSSFILRVYAVMHGELFFVGVLTILGLLSTALDIVQIKELSCTQASSPLAFVMTFLSLIAFDIIATILILWKLVDVIKKQRGLLSGSVASLILRSGALYFVTITSIQLGAVILYWLPKGLYSGILNDYTTLVSSILISRFILDLRGLSSGKDFSPEHDGQVSTLDFAHNPTGEYNTEQTGTTSKWTSLVRDFEGAPESPLGSDISWQMDEYTK